MTGGDEARKKIFLLGGHDLEMESIKVLLEDKGVQYADHHLRWDNARLSQYREEIREYAERGYRIYGIELEEDMEIPTGYIAIDHHNENMRKASAIEQVIEILGITPSRHTELVAANDKHYIGGMEAIGATKAEIEEIRRADRASQGVTEEDERKAIKSIEENMKRYGKLITVRAEGEKFSPICDRLYPYESLLIYNDESMVYYGKGAEEMRRSIAEEREKGIYFGGGEDGYFGLKEQAYSKDEIEKRVNIIIEKFKK